MKRIGLTLMIVAVVLYAACRSRWVYHWDGALFALAMRGFNVAISEPHAPGYFLYVQAGRLVNLFIGDPHASLVWLDIVAGAALVAVVFALGTAMFSQRAGTAAALFAMTSPLVWFHSCVALSYIIVGLLVCITVWWCWRAVQRGVGWADALGLGVLLALVGGVRPQTAPELLPLVAFTLWHARESRAAKFFGTGAMAVVAGLCWFVPMVWMSGGLATYLECVRRMAAFNAPLTLAAGGAEAFQWNVYRLVFFAANGLMLAGMLVVGGLLTREFRRSEHAGALRMLAWWVVPMWVMGTLVSFTRQSGFALSWLPALLLMAGAAAGRWRLVTAAVCIVNVVTFFAWNGREIRVHDRQLSQTVRVLRERFDPQATTLCHAGEYYLFGMRHFQLHLPEFEQVQLVTDTTLLHPRNKPLPAVRGGRLVFTDGVPRDGSRRLVLVVPPGYTAEIFRQHLGAVEFSPVPGAGGLLYEVKFAQRVSISSTS